ncbi:MAG TPA: DMT family transporter [Rhodospirillales bacterium]|jgi:drug/metabolite transporter (DMT)-like permease|nr:DMT family transporter [Rhodospirillales bacterium]HIL74330.1 DMT family transporter [Rhodospirillales bacterium]
MDKTNPLLGISLMLAAMAVNSSKDGIAKLLAPSYSPLTILFIQFVTTSLILAPIVIKKNGVRRLIPDKLLPQALRSSFIAFGLGLFYWAINFINIADATAMVFVAPLIVTALSPAILGEPIGLRRTISVIIGFIGVLIILRPTMDGDRTGYFIALGAGIFLAAYYIANRKLANEAPILASTFYTSFLGAIILSPLLLIFWNAPGISDFWILFGFTTLATLGQIFIIGAFSFVAANIIAPFVYTQIIWATMIGYILFDAFPDKWGWVGIAIVIATGVYIAIREINLKKG